MLRILGGGSARLCDGVSRRELLRVGGAGLLGSALALSDLAGTSARGSVEARAGFGRARSCLVVFLMGGPPQHSLWDPKPDAPAEVRGPYGPIATSAPGLDLCELTPNLARLGHKLCLLRAVATDDNAHSSSGYYMMTGRPHTPMNFENANPGAPNDAPTLGGLVSKFGGSRAGVLPPAVRMPHRIFNTDGSIWPGQDAGTLGRSLDPWLLHGEPDGDGGKLRFLDVSLPQGLDAGRLGARRSLLDDVARGADAISANETARAMDANARRALEIVSSTGARRALDLETADPRRRDRYGRSPFGQTVLLGRQLVGAGVRLVQVNWYRGADEPADAPCWDSHAREPQRLKEVLVPPTDQALSALIEDLDATGELDETLVLVMSEFGRSPRLDAAGGRGHWGHVFTIAMAGGGVRGGYVHGASDKFAAHPREGLVKPEDLTATVLHCLGIEPESEYRDLLDRPLPASRGRVIEAIL